LHLIATQTSFERCRRAVVGVTKQVGVKAQTDGRIGAPDPATDGYDKPAAISCETCVCRGACRVTFGSLSMRIFVPSLP
jgi:hypothetical protein